MVVLEWVVFYCWMFVFCWRGSRAKHSGLDLSRELGGCLPNASPLRYGDDMGLRYGAIEEFLVGLRLKIHPIKSQLYETALGANFVGFRVMPDRIRVRNDNLRRGRLRLRRLQREYGRGAIDREQFQNSLNSWMAHLNHGDTFRLRQSICDWNSIDFGIG
jgi:hypothetical protein